MVVGRATGRRPGHGPRARRTSCPSRARSRAAAAPRSRPPTTADARTLVEAVFTRLGSHVVKVMTALFGPIDAIERARALRDAGASGVFTFEGPHDVFAPLTLASTVGGLDLMTNVAIAFPRNPIHLAHQAIDHQLLSGGRFTLGLGTQIRTQIEKRFGADFDKPVARMAELVGALRAIFAAWTTGERLDFRGEYYRHTLMTPTFTPGRVHGPPPIYVGALGPRLTRATAEVADGLLVMPFGSKRFLHEVTMPDVRRGSGGGGRSQPRGVRGGARRSSCRSARATPTTPPPGTAGVLRLHARLPPGAGGARLGRPAARAQHAVQAGPLGGDGRADRRRHAAHHRRMRHARPRWPRTFATGWTASPTGSACTSRARSRWRHWREIVDALSG